MANTGLPDVFDPIFEYLSEALPPPLYWFVTNALSHYLALLSAIYSLILPLISTSPLKWDAQKILPPIITLFAAYLALLSFYRTTTWMLRTSIFFVKWGTILGVIAAGAGFLLGSANGDGNGVGSFGVISGLGGMLLDLINGKGQNAAGGTRSGSHPQRSRTTTKGSEKKKPKPWEPFERHREWQHQDNQDRAGVDAQQVISKIIGGAGQVVRESGWWTLLKGIVDGAAAEETRDEGKGGRGQQPKSQTKSKAGTSRSR
ncbi:hypothetical protein H0H81_005346 [Sphagnurus paluster]|uniref:Uncharacterized protein n=1 Tax=Sphagnurus paluster TaxID=117069 RepID=A0A9P7FRZ3_9AGAR|nr:hypothetical protein H0H81_005346 [Sphagnurus paluster]